MWKLIPPLMLALFVSGCVGIFKGGNVKQAPLVLPAKPRGCIDGSGGFYAAQACDWINHACERSERIICPQPALIRR